MNPLDLFIVENFDKLDTPSATHADGACFFRAHYTARNRRGSRVTRYVEARFETDVQHWTYRSGYAHHEDRQFWAVPVEYRAGCLAFAEHVARAAAAEHRRAIRDIESAGSRAGFSIA